MQLPEGAAFKMRDSKYKPPKSTLQLPRSCLVTFQSALATAQQPPRALYATFPFQFKLGLDQDFLSLQNTIDRLFMQSIFQKYIVCCQQASIKFYHVLCSQIQLSAVCASLYHQILLQQTEHPLSIICLSSCDATIVMPPE